MNTLVAGSYPPAPGPATAATLAAVRGALARGDTVTVVSPRASAAHRRAHLGGWRAATSLGRLSRHQDRLVLVAQPGMPFDDADRGAVGALAGVIRSRYRIFELWLVEPGRLSVSPIRTLWPLAARVVVAAAAEVPEVASRFDIPEARIDIDTAAAPASSAAALDLSTVTPFGPPDWTPREQPRRIASMAIRRVLGKRTDAVRAQVLRAVTAARRAPRATQQRPSQNR